MAHRVKFVADATCAAQPSRTASFSPTAQKGPFTVTLVQQMDDVLTGASESRPFQTLFPATRWLTHAPTVAVVSRLQQENR